jgi:sRNA-binding carbon storage regulator CsrA
MERTRLILERRHGEALNVGDARIRFELRGRRIRLVIEAPKELRIVREEVRHRAA